MEIKVNLTEEVIYRSINLKHMREVNRKIYGKRAFQAEETANTKTLRQDGS